MDDVDSVVIGAGVVGLACARALAQRGRTVLVLEREARFGSVTSARNSGVIHAGLYYPPGSWRGRLCVRGREQLYAYCAERGVPYRAIGKLIVADDDAELAALQALARQARACGVTELDWLPAEAMRAREPALAGLGALWSPRTGIVDAHALMQALLTDAERHGAQLVTHCEVLTVHPQADRLCLRTRDVGDGSVTELAVREVVNAAGLGAHALAAAMPRAAGPALPPLHLARGAYARLRSGRAPFQHLVYPAPGASGHLGIHFTLDLGGQARFGPGLRWVDRPEHAIGAKDIEGFEAAVRRYWPGLPAGALEPDFAGLRPKLSGPGEPAVDFRIDGPAEHGVPGLVQLLGLDSPGLTASLAIADEVLQRLSSA